MISERNGDHVTIASKYLKKIIATATVLLVGGLYLYTSTTSEETQVTSGQNMVTSQLENTEDVNAALYALTRVGTESAANDSKDKPQSDDDLTSNNTLDGNTPDVISIGEFIDVDEEYSSEDKFESELISIGPSYSVDQTDAWPEPTDQQVISIGTPIPNELVGSYEGSIDDEVITIGTPLEIGATPGNQLNRAEPPQIIIGELIPPPDAPR